MGKSETQVSRHILQHPTSQHTLAEEFKYSLRQQIIFTTEALADSS